MNTFRFLCLFIYTLVSVISLPLGAAGVKPSAPLNVLFISIDDLNDWTAFLGGHPQAKTPNMDRLAQMGVSFNDAHCQAPLCGPSRASVLTGLLPSTSGIYLHVKDAEIKKSNLASSTAIFLPDYFEQYGYKTYAAGKVFHLGDRAQVFDEYLGYKDFGPYPAEHFSWEDPLKKTSTDWGAFPESDSKLPDFAVADYAVEKLSHSQGRPFFLAVGFNRPHVPWHVPQKWFDLFPLEEVELPRYLPTDFEDIPAIATRITETPPTPTTEWCIENKEWRKAVQAYLACVAFVDAQVGRILDALDSGPHSDNTLIVLWSDHGYHLGEKNRFAKMSLWERSTRVPLIFAGPGVMSGGRSELPVGLIDIYPTLLDLAKLPGLKQLDGQSLVPILKEPDYTDDRIVSTFYGPKNISMIDNTHHYIVYEDGAEELYDRSRDKDEWVNLANDSQMAEKLSSFREKKPENVASMSRYNSLTWNAYWVEKMSELKKSSD